MAPGDLPGPLPERGFIGEVADPARDGPGLPGVGDQDPDVNALRDELPGAYIVQRLLDHPVQGLPRENRAKSMDTFGCSNARSTCGR